MGPWFPQAARLLRENPGLDVGLHLTLTSERDSVKWSRGEDVIVRDSRAAAGTDAFVEATDVTGRAVLTGNHVRKAKRPVVPPSFAELT